MIEIKKITSKLGSIVESNKDIESLVGWSSEDIFEKIGIKQRYISNEGESSEILALEAVQKIDYKDLEECDLIISVTNTPGNGFPTIAHFIHSEIGLTKNTKCLGLNAGCTGFVDALEVVYSFFSSDFSSKALIINSDTYSKYLSNDRSTRTIFSDGATATIVHKEPSGLRLVNKISSTGIKTYDYLIKKDFEGIDQIKMNGPKVLQFAMGNVSKDLNKIIDEDNEYTLFPHQAGKLVLEVLRKKLTPNVKILNNFEANGNLVSASIPNLLREQMDLIKKDNIVFSGFGVGLSHNALVFSNLHDE